MSDGAEHHSAAAEAKQHLAGRPVLTPGHESGVARYLGAQHYREQRMHRAAEKTEPSDAVVEETATPSRTESSIVDNID